MDKQTEQFFKKIEIQTVGSAFPSIQNNADIAMFIKQSIDDDILYTDIQDKRIDAFVSENNNQPHQNTAFELFYVLEGTVIKTIEEKEYILRKGEGCILNRRITHSDDLKDGFMLVLNFTEDYFRKITHDLSTEQLQGPVFSFLHNNCTESGNWKKSYMEFHPTVPVVDRRFQTILDSLQQELATRKLGADFFLQGLLLRLLSCLENPHSFRLNVIDINSSKEDFLVDRLISFIESNYGKVSRKEISKALHYNDEYLNRLLKRSHGLTISTYARNVRLNRAKELLMTTDLTVAEIARLLDFSSENYFYHFFSKVVGISPKKYREAHSKSS
ncbi:AraC family transcriptional regulator [Lactobacillus sp. 23-2]|jgi:AraC-like DNA-binding protein|uniref:AraC family transcriptional regulator n=1 Tax=Lactobacillus sp. 23-2 TaxID=2981842 RepID=UPI0038388A67